MHGSDWSQLWVSYTGLALSHWILRRVKCYIMYCCRRCHGSRKRSMSVAYTGWRKNPIDQRNPPKRNSTNDTHLKVDSEVRFPLIQTQYSHRARLHRAPLVIFQWSVTSHSFAANACVPPLRRPTLSARWVRCGRTLRQITCAYERKGTHYFMANFSCISVAST